MTKRSMLCVKRATNSKMYGLKASIRPDYRGVMEWL